MNPLDLILEGRSPDDVLEQMLQEYRSPTVGTWDTHSGGEAPARSLHKIAFMDPSRRKRAIEKASVNVQFPMHHIEKRPGYHVVQSALKGFRDTASHAQRMWGS